MTELSPNDPAPQGVIRRPFDLHTGITLLISIVIGAILIAPGATLFGFVDYPSLAIVVGVVVAFLLITHGFNATMRGVAISFRGISGRMDEVRLAVDVCDAGLHSSVLGGCLGIVIGLVIMLGNLSDPSSIGPGMAVSLLSIFYSILLAILFLAGRFRIANSARELSTNESATASAGTTIAPPSKTVIALIPLFVSSHLLVFLILLAAVSEIKPSYLPRSKASPAGVQTPTP